MNLRCIYCQTPFTLERSEMLTAIIKMNNDGSKHYDAHCPRCRRANSISRQRMELFYPNWQDAAKQMASLAIKKVSKPLPKPTNLVLQKPDKRQPTTKKKVPSKKVNPKPIKQKRPAKAASATSDLAGRKGKIAPKAGSCNIFISYRRSDSADIAGRIYDRLIDRFGKNPVFKDVDSIPLGLDFKEYLGKKVGDCVVLLAIIGDRWLDASYPSRKKRLKDPSDFVRIEIESALERGIPVIPLMVRGAEMPHEDLLPPSLRKLVYRNGIPIRSDPDFHRDMDRLISALEKIV
jgi:hypothetical protein